MIRNEHSTIDHARALSSRPVSTPSAEAWRRLHRKIAIRLSRRYDHRDMPPSFGIDDLIQETLLALLRGLDDFEPRSRSEFWSWIERVAEARRVDALRREQAKKRGGARPPAADATEICVDPGSSPSVNARLVELEARFQTALAALKPRHREVLELRILQQLSFAEIARRMGYERPDTVRVLLARARSQLELVD